MRGLLEYVKRIFLVKQRQLYGLKRPTNPNWQNFTYRKRTFKTYSFLWNSEVDNK